MTSFTQKHILRDTLKNKRHLFVQEQGIKSLKKLSEKLITFFKESIPFSLEQSIAGYWPLSEELNCLPLLTYLHSQCHNCSLPCVTALGTPLVFRSWSPLDSLELCPLFPAGLRLMQPTPRKEVILPDIILVPILGFDRQGYRIGYGGGFYDMTIRSLRTQKKIIAIGISYACQEISPFQHEVHDEKLDYMLTEKGPLSFI